MTATDNKPLLVLKDIHAAYVKKEILRGISLLVRQGEIIALLGGNGSGKSTLLKTIAGLLLPTQGTTTFNGSNVTGDSVHARQRLGIGLLLQGGKVFPNLTVAENFEIAKLNVFNHRFDESKIGRFFPQLKERSADRAGLLSGGQKQMLAIEMVLVQQPRLVLMDEPTAALSSDMSRAILGKILEYSRQSGCSVLVVEQNVAEAKGISTRCLRLNEGQIQELTTNEKGQ